MLTRSQFLKVPRGCNVPIPVTLCSDIRGPIFRHRRTPSEDSDAPKPSRRDTQTRCQGLSPPDRHIYEAGHSGHAHGPSEQGRMFAVSLPRAFHLIYDCTVQYRHRIYYAFRSAAPCLISFSATRSHFLSFPSRVHSVTVGLPHPRTPCVRRILEPSLSDPFGRTSTSHPYFTRFTWSPPRGVP